MGVIFSYCKYLYQKRRKNSSEKLDFEGLKLFFYVNRYYHDGFFDILIKHNLYGNHEQVTRTLQVSNLNSENTNQFIKLLLSYEGKGIVHVDKDRGLYLSGKVFVKNKDSNPNNGNYVELVSLINKTEPTTTINTEEKEETKNELSTSYDLEIVIDNFNDRKKSNSLSNHKIIDNFIQL
jgi:hypothetical protein